MLTDQSYGIIPVIIKDSKPQFLLVHHEEGHWAFPKGHPEKNETKVETAQRELKEETNLEVEHLYNEPLLEEKYWYTNKDGQKVLKRVHFFIATVTSEDVKVQPEEIVDFAWLDFEHALDKMTFPQGKKVLQEAYTFLKQSP